MIATHIQVFWSLRGSSTLSVEMLRTRFPDFPNHDDPAAIEDWLVKGDATTADFLDLIDWSKAFVRDGKSLEIEDIVATCPPATPSKDAHEVDRPDDER